MKKTKMFYGNQYIGSVLVDGSKPEKKALWFKRTKEATIAWFKIGTHFAIATAFVVGMMLGYNHFNAKTVHAEKIITVEVPVEIIPPVMERIAKCESGGTHYRNGQVIFNGNTDRSTDIGYFQINSIHSKQASSMGLDLTTEEDNKAFAMHLYKTQGTEPWYSSKHCWNK